MGRVVDHDVRRAEVVRATWEVIAAEGLEAATVRRIATQAECTTGLVTHYFDSKDDVLVAALRAVHRAAAQRMLAHLDGPDARDVLRAVLLEALPLDAVKRLEWKVWLAFWGAAATDDRLRAEQTQRYSEWRALLADLVTKARPGESATITRAAVDVLSSAVDGLGMQAVLEPSAFTPRRVRSVVDTLLETLA